MDFGSRFFPVVSRRPVWLGRTETADLLVDGNQVRTNGLEPMELLDFSLGFAEGGGSGEALRDRLAVNFASETELRVMAGIVGLSAMKGGLAAASDHYANGPRTEITQGLHLLEQAWLDLLPGRARNGA